MNKQDLILGLGLVFVVLIAAFWLRSKDSKVNINPTPTPVSIEDKIESSFKITIPENVSKVELKSIAEFEGWGIVTKEDVGNTKKYTVLADLPELKSGEKYVAYFSKEKISNEKQDILKAGELRVNKGGWILEYDTTSDLSNYQKLQVYLENKSSNTVILEGSF